MWCAIELPDVHHVVLVLQHSRFVVVDVKVVRGTKDGHDTWEPSRPRLSVHSITSILSLMSSNDRQQIVLLQEGTCGRVGKEVRATPDVVVHKELRCLFLPKFLEWIRPQDITHQTMSGRFAETVNLEGSVSVGDQCI